MIAPAELEATFSARFARRTGPLLWAAAPGRVNLIGEHIDYNGGHVMPMALEMGVTILGRRAEGPVCRLHATAFDETAEFALPVGSPSRTAPWSNYAAGVVKHLAESGIECPPFEAVVGADLPVGAGLSSSAAFEVAAAAFALRLAGAELDPTETALLCQRAENEYVGMNCGIMDQFTSVHAKRGHALFLDCGRLKCKDVPLVLGTASIVVTDTRVHHALGSSAYNTRRRECEEALAAAGRRWPGLEDLASLGPERLREIEAELGSVVARRARHVVTEEARTVEAASALERGDPARFGELLWASHASLRDDYEVSCAELDLAVETARGVEGVLGSRMTGGGFGGATVSLVESRAVGNYRDDVNEAFAREVGHEPAFHVVRPGGGYASGALDHS
jgi:galactokinase